MTHKASHSIQKQQNTQSSQGHMEHSPGEEHMLGHKTSLNKFKKIKVILSIFPDHNAIQLEIDYEKITGKFTCGD